ncbi:MAG: tryptophan synthase subunit alpha [Acidobacteria bacterium]|nr:tryptophan synthase subunit alpha [Acidobacteriota bacterium]
MSRIARTFDRLRQQGRPGLVTYITAGDPDLARSGEILEALDRAGADVLEVGVPFSDPMADGPVIQRASERALAAGATLDGVLDMVAQIRPVVRAPIVLFSYANPLYRMGFDRFATRAAAAEVDGVLALDLPLEEAEGLRGCLRGVGLDMIFLLSPTTSPERMRRAGELGSGFVYAISRLGVTGARDVLALGIQDLVTRIREATTMPVAVGFGVSTAAHVAEVCKWADAAVVGSALVKVIEQHGASPDLVARVEQYVRQLKGDPA